MSEQPAYIARLTSQTEAQLRAIIDQCVGAGYAFAGDAVSLSPPKGFVTAVDLELNNDFGHAYSAQAEVRWRRNPDRGKGQDTSYNVLVLTEDQRYRPPGAKDITGTWRVRATQKDRYVMLTGGSGRVRLYEYWDAEGTGATIFARYGEVKP
jgi:hypothetical protein